MYLIETHVNETKGYRLGEPTHTEAHTDNLKALFKSLQKEYGRCVSKLYCDLKDGSTKVVGWVFSKRRQYDDCKETYEHTVWVELAQNIVHHPARYEVTPFYLEA